MEEKLSTCTCFFLLLLLFKCLERDDSKKRFLAIIATFNNFFLLNRVK